MKTETPEGLPREELPQGVYVLKLLARAQGFTDTPELDAALEAFASERLGVTGSDEVSAPQQLVLRGLRMLTTHLEQFGLERCKTDG